MAHIDSLNRITLELRGWPSVSVDTRNKPPAASNPATRPAIRLSCSELRAWGFFAAPPVIVNTTEVPSRVGSEFDYWPAPPTISLASLDSISPTSAIYSKSNFPYSSLNSALGHRCNPTSMMAETDSGAVQFATICSSISFSEV